MLIDGIKVEAMRFDNLREFLKPLSGHYILKYELKKDKAIYYWVSDGANFVYVAYCIDKNHKENIKIEGNTVCEAPEPSGNTIIVTKVSNDTFLEALIKHMKLDLE